jgi:hypothetical protein
MLRRVLREARTVARKERIAMRVRLDLKKPEEAAALPIWRDIADRDR